MSDLTDLSEIIIIRPGFECTPEEGWKTYINLKKLSQPTSLEDIAKSGLYFNVGWLLRHCTMRSMAIAVGFFLATEQYNYFYKYWNELNDTEKQTCIRICELTQNGNFAPIMSYRINHT